MTDSTETVIENIKSCINSFTSWVLHTDDTYVIYTHDDKFRKVPAHTGHLSELDVLHPLLSISMSCSLAWFHKNQPSRVKALYADEVRATLNYLTHGGLALTSTKGLPLFITRIRSVNFSLEHDDAVMLECEESFIKECKVKGKAIPFVVQTTNKLVEVRTDELEKCAPGWHNRYQAHQCLDGTPDDLMRLVFLPAALPAVEISSVVFDNIEAV